MATFKLGDAVKVKQIIAPTMLCTDGGSDGKAQVILYNPVTGKYEERSFPETFLELVAGPEVS
ncbi:hypothetical protein BPNPMPFG_000921 [Mesorhizobium sp. AR07]|uniref:hypothetical protein n=1 Tax=Mesorhizobium sp. AR07 TaxID=2865838 RepID=UPI00215FCF06|nr:hypothetical protein [Mesorhizobium sp. AR07]UVK45391.1 hypothetical protein BPNPMPFG_000921 [Mesorhizobium sp. AR07]